MRIYCLLIIILIIIILYKNNYIDRYTDYNVSDKYPVVSSEGVSYLSNGDNNYVIITHASGSQVNTVVDYKFVDSLANPAPFPNDNPNIIKIKKALGDENISDWDSLDKAKSNVENQNMKTLLDNARRTRYIKWLARPDQTASRSEWTKWYKEKDNEWPDGSGGGKYKWATGGLGVRGMSMSEAWNLKNPQEICEEECQEETKTEILKKIEDVNTLRFTQKINYLTVRVSNLNQSTYKYIIKIVTANSGSTGSTGSCDLKYTDVNNLEKMSGKPTVEFAVGNNSASGTQYQFGYYHDNKIYIKTDVTNKLTYAHYNKTLYTATVSNVSNVSNVSKRCIVQINNKSNDDKSAITFDKPICIHLLHVTNDSIYLITTVEGDSVEDDSSNANIHKFPNTTIVVTGETDNNNGSSIILQNNKQIIDYDIDPDTDNITIVQNK